MPTTSILHLGNATTNSTTKIFDANKKVIASASASASSSATSEISKKEAELNALKLSTIKSEELSFNLAQQVLMGPVGVLRNDKNKNKIFFGSTPTGSSSETNTTTTTT